MRIRALHVVASSAALFAACAVAAVAEPLEASLALTINALSGRHEVSAGGIDRLTFAPLPLAEITLRRHADELRIEGLPPVTFSYGAGSDGAQSTRLSIVNATYRRRLGHGLFVGAGQTVYNQITTYQSVRGGFTYSRGTIIEPIDGSEAQYSRVTGPRFELGEVVALGRQRLEFGAAVNPKMHGVQYTRIPTFIFSCPFRTGLPPTFVAGGGAPAGCMQLVDTFSDPENATQVDLSARLVRRVSKFGEVIYGLRYLNYVAHYDDLPGQLADRNVGFAPTIGFRVRL